MEESELQYPAKSKLKNIHSKENFGKKTFGEKLFKKIMFFVVFWAKSSWTSRAKFLALSENFSFELSKLRSTYPTEHFGVKEMNILTPNW